MTKTIFIDLDGVCADFDEEFYKRHGMTPDECREEGIDFWQKFNENPTNFYRDMPPCPDMMFLLDGVAELARIYDCKVEILTAIPRMTTYPTAESEKREWCKKHGIGDIPFNIGPHSKDKQNHCKPGDILIDDNVLNIKQWFSKGGLGILYKDGVDDVFMVCSYLAAYLEQDKQLNTRKGF